MSKNFLQSLAVIILATLLASCGKQTHQGSAYSLSTPVIIGEVDWKPINSMVSAVVKTNSTSVADLRIRTVGSRCTGFLISDDILMTNFHCIKSPADAADVVAIFNHVEGSSSDSWEKFNCSNFVGNDRSLDYALLRCVGNPGEKYGHVELSTYKVPIGTPIYVIQQNCDYFTTQDCDFFKIYSYGTIVGRDGVELTHNADTLGGSSGSPVFSQDSNKVIAIHHAGEPTDRRGRGSVNYAVSMPDIVAQIQTKYPEILLEDL